MGRKRKASNRVKPITSDSKIKSTILQLLNSDASKAYSIKRIVKQLGFRDKPTKHIIPNLVIELEHDEKIHRLRNGSFKSVKKPAFHEGIVDHVSSRFAFLITEEFEEDIWVRTSDLKFAMDRDKVRFVIKKKGKRKRLEGKVVEILSRSRDQYVGKIEITPKYAFVIPDSRKIYYDFFIRPENMNKVKPNDKVIVKVLRWPAHDLNPEGKVIKVLGQAGENETEIHSIMAEFGLPFTFPESVIDIAEKIDEKISPKETKRRRDFRDVLTFTIDPADAKDFDDAISFQMLENGNYEVGVHIADVTHYVKEGSALDKEAFKRATSVYLVDRTIPMLPEKLSNEICSLKPQEDKLTFSVVFEMNEQAKVINQWFGRTIIHSDRRFTYEEAQERIETSKGDLATEICKLNKISENLREERFKSGAVNFEIVEVKFELGKNSEPLRIVPKIRKEAHKLIEEFMLLANKKVAEKVFKLKSGKKKRPFVYRTHDYPDPEKIAAFSNFVKKFGHNLKTNESSIAESINSLIDNIIGKPEENVLQSLAIRSMAKAKYTIKADGHFGLAFNHYTHFTSPIRRYPDMMVHRLLYAYLNKNGFVEEENLEDKCIHSSEMEKIAAGAERASIKFKQVEFIENTENKDYEGVVSGVTEWGLFVEIIENRCEGMIRLSDMLDDFYEFDEQNFRIIGKRNKKMITLGDKIKVRVIRTDIDRRIIDLDRVE